MKHFKTYTLFMILLCPVIFSGCRKLISVDTPQNQLTTDKVFKDATSATAAMVSTYALFDKTIDVNYNKFMGFYSDELNYTGATQEYIDYVQSAVFPANATNLNFWKNSYFAIYQCNDMIEQLNHSVALPTTTVTQYTAEAKFLRAWSYFYLVNTYGKVPLILHTDVNNNENAVNADSVTVYSQIIQDLKDAQVGLKISYIGSGKVRANKYAATALLSRIYLWQRNWPDAESNATMVINSGLYTPLPSTANTFLATSQETILSFWTQNGFINDAPGIIPSSGAPGYFYTSGQLNTFETGDLRKTNWIKSTTVGTTTYYYPYKYHNRTANTSAPEYLIALRATEQFLIRAEARVQQGNITGAIADLNIVRTRAGLTAYSGTIDKLSVVAAILHERCVEFFTEWGNRFLDLKRTGTLSSVISVLKPTWKPTAVVLPIPQNEINTDPMLIQNQGY
ncbi:RagB/SusD family nutrient uptake outer membrane protein [Mucilaginibacter sp. HMF5004]|uniref:RagB/SusD family nutrient uptake outer membrane protein n=1 Tax=Mucilaginibacter rivuli TaxID=2857527 RepID=UPI001C5FBC97|nr:RagB/SusD family nutrient uptake outer membrane protein [Mucilaginibacter rivuli]MBW4888943.1 RagB/SusD family nutrient uptake outer membrane protein [Mucilaginibacter rivuli]